MSVKTPSTRLQKQLLWSALCWKELGALAPLSSGRKPHFIVRWGFREFKLSPANLDISYVKKKHPYEIEVIVKAFNEVTDEYAENNKIVFANESERASKHFGGISHGLKRWSKAQFCMVPSCNNRSIVRSHTVPKGMLTAIGEAGHVLEPVFDHKAGTVKLNRIGLSNATTFPGFCNVHELLFEEFENKKKIDTESHIYLQTYRAACRELVRLEFGIEQHDWTMAEYCKSRDVGLRRLLIERVQQRIVIDEVVFESIKFVCDPLVETANEHIESVRTQAIFIKESLLPALEKAVFHGDDTDVCVVAQNLDLEIPVTLAGAAAFFMNDNGEEKEITLLMNVVPCIGNTLVIFAGLRSQSVYIEAYKNRWMTHALSYLSMIESWMINGTDQWCLKPSVWEALPKRRQSKLIELLVGANRNIGDDCELSIFDDIRKNIIQMSDDANVNCITKEYQSFIAKQKNKMA